MIITIDGPTASGKSTVARALAKKLDLYYLNTGFLYRAVAYLLKKECNYDEACFANPQDSDLKKVLDLSRFSYRYDAQVGESVHFDGQDITPYLRTPDIATGASVLGSHPIVREALLAYQRELAKATGVVAEGRDTGSVVFPHADVKFYLTASIERRAHRYFIDATRKDTPATEQEVAVLIQERDKRDKERKTAPLIVPEGAIVIDNSDIDLQQTIELMLSHVRNAE